jgi:hypothetical protein
MKNLDLVKIPNQKELLKKTGKKILVPKIDYGYQDKNTKSTVIFSLYLIRTRAGWTLHIQLQLTSNSGTGTAERQETARSVCAEVLSY